MEEKEQYQATRAGNLTAAERLLTVDLVQKHWVVVENKKSDAVTVKEKARTWQLITAEFNAATAT